MVEFPEGISPFIPAHVPRRKDEDKKAGRGKGVFRSVLGARIGESGSRVGPVSDEPFSQEKLESLLDCVHEAGDALKENPSADHVIDYKKSVRDFVHYIVEGAYAVEQKSSGRNVLKRNIYYRVAVIDESLEKLGAEILRNQRDKLDILRRIDEINGMLVDLVT